MQAKMKKMLEEAQAFICKSVEDVDGGATFRLDHWTRENGDVGVTAVMAGGKVPLPPSLQPSSHRSPPLPHVERLRPAPAKPLTPPASTQVWEKAGCNLAVVRGGITLEYLCVVE